MALQAMAPDGQPLPEQAKLSVLHGDCCAEAYLELPTAASKPAVSKLPAIVWATIGLLAKDGLTLQVSSATTYASISYAVAVC